MACNTYSINGKNRFLVTALMGGGEQYVANVKSVTGLEREVEVSEWKSGDLPTAMKLPGTIKYPVIGLHKGFDQNHFFSAWFDTIWNEGGSGAIPCRTLFIYVLDRAGNTFRKIQVNDSWPSKYSGDDLDGTSNDPWMESVEIANSGWKYVVTTPPPAAMMGNITYDATITEDNTN